MSIKWLALHGKGYTSVLCLHTCALLFLVPSFAAPEINGARRTSSAQFSEIVIDVFSGRFCLGNGAGGGSGVQAEEAVERGGAAGGERGVD